MKLKDAFLFVRSKRSVIQPKTAFMKQLILYERQLFGRNTVQIVEIKRSGVKLQIPNFYVTDCPELIENELSNITGGGIKKDELMEQLSERSVL